MKKFLLSFVAIIFVFSCAFAYEPTEKDEQDLINLKNQLGKLTSGNNIDLWNYYDQIVNLQSDYSTNERLNYMLETLKYYLYSDKNNKNSLSKQKTNLKTLSKEKKQDFVDSYSSGISVEIDDSLKNCTGRYKTLDDISFAYDFPTALTIATWYRESSCAYYSPNNGDGPFQIKNSNYKTGEITQREFSRMIVDFMKFTKKKFDRYNGVLSGELHYDNFDLTGIVNFVALYNGGTRSGNTVVPNIASYAFDGYGEDYSGAKRYGIIPQMIKVLEWELENEY